MWIQVPMVCLSSGTGPTTPPPCGHPALRTRQLSPFYMNCPWRTAQLSLPATSLRHNYTSQGWKKGKPTSLMYGRSVMDSGSLNTPICVLRWPIQPTGSSLGPPVLIKTKVILRFFSRLSQEEVVHIAKAIVGSIHSWWSGQ